MSKFSLQSVLPQPRTTVRGKIHTPYPSDRISEFSHASLSLLTQLLTLTPGSAPNPAWLLHQASLMQTLPPCLLHPKSSGLLPRLATSLSSLRLGETRAVLCPTHHALNPHLIRKIFLELTAECTSRLQHLARAPASELAPTVRDFVARMQKLNSIWMQPELYRQAYQVMPWETRYERVASGCEACILATVGGDPGIVRDLYASILGRRRRNRRMEGWIEVVRGWESEQGDIDALSTESAELGREIRRCRKHFQRLRRAARREQLGGVKNPLDRYSEGQALMVHESLDEEKDDEGAHVDGIIDFYANMMSRSSLANGSATQNPHSAEGIHDAFRNTMIYSGGFFQNASRPVQERSQSVYSRSEYGTSQMLQQGAEERAKAYRKLIGLEENDPASDEDDEDDKLHFTNPRAPPAPPSPRTTRQENKPKHKIAPYHRRPEPLVSSVTRTSHVAYLEGKNRDRDTRFSDFI
ncbi:hypothetical protein DSL72_007660 [Monilinia vaccinii-corymbosi]|uniref:Uncharacterized protein n=1 Tax=Monilinia vaccinii-corymbosi TaxID=61207 RepID=A0A8A3PHQ0_9HELO|nr:hypothetical protein DSL72_007660 [Monilinia vaccinii-corymbosi]